MIGAGGIGETYIHRILPQFADRLEVVGLVDISAPVLGASGDYLSLASSQRFTDLAAALEVVEADFCIVAIPSAFHKMAVQLAADRGLPILCEKPLADSWEACRDIYRAVKRANVKMEVVQNYRYRASALAMREVLRSGQLGRINIMVVRFGDDCREHGTWKNRHDLPHAMLVDGAVHHLDMLRNLSGADCARIAAFEWNPPWSNSTADFCVLCSMRLTNDARASYEASATAAGEQNGFRQEYYRVECEGGSVTVSRDLIVRLHRHTRRQGLVTEEVPAPVLRHEDHAWIVSEFVDWLEGGATPATVVDDNIRTAAMVFGALEAARTEQMVDVERMVKDVVEG
jgi:predicted dehydrogenase